MSENPISIGIDVRRADRKGRGISIYTQTNLAEFSRIAKDDRFMLLHYPDRKPGFDFQTSNFNFVNLPFFSESDPWERIIQEQKEYPEFQRKLGIDVMWHPQNHGQYWTPVGYVCTMHDVLPLDRPDLSPNLGNSVPSEKALSDSRIFSIVGADSVIVPTNFSKNTLLKYVRLDPDKIHVINTGIDHGIFNVNFSESAALTRRRFGLHEKYILTVGSFAPHKNLPTLIKAFHESRLFRKGYQLVLVGPMDGVVYTNCADDIKNLIKQLDITDYVKLISTIGLDDLVDIYKGASQFCITSEYEGFGAPPTEAMACGVPVLTSNSTALPEVCGNAALYSDPFDYKSFAHFMNLLDTDQYIRSQLISLGLEKAKHYNWSNTARSILSVLRLSARKDEN